MLSTLVWPRLVGVLLFSALPFHLFAPEDRRPVEALRLEQAERWREAADFYAAKSQAEPPFAAYWLGEAQRCRFHRRLKQQVESPILQAHLAGLSPLACADLYGETLDTIAAQAHAAIGPSELFAAGVRDLDRALGNAAFRKAAFPAGLAEASQLRLQAELRQRWEAIPIRRRTDAVRHFQALLLRWRQEFGASPAPLSFIFLQGACAAVDEHSAFLPPFWREREALASRSDLASLGLALSEQGDGLAVQVALPGGSAAQAGLAANCQVLALDGQPAQTLSLDEAEMLMLGLADSSVTIEWQGPLDAMPRNASLRRRPLNLPTVSEARLADAHRKIGYLQILLFDDHTPIELDAALRKLHGLGATALLLDLRGNPGGSLTSAAAVASRFLPPETVAFVSVGRGKQPVVRYLTRGGPSVRLPIVLLLDRGTASAAEALAAALEEQLNAVTVGERTWGKGTVQQLLPLKSQGVGLRLTTSAWLTSKGNDLNGRGLQPQVDLESAGSGPDSPLATAQLRYEAALRVAQRLAPPHDTQQQAR